MEGSREFVKDLSPGICGKVKPVRIQIIGLLDLCKTVFTEDLSPQSRELLVAHFEKLDQIFQIDVHRLRLCIAFVTEAFHGLAALDPLPIGFIALHERKKG